MVADTDHCSESTGDIFEWLHDHYREQRSYHRIYSLRIRLFLLKPAVQLVDMQKVIVHILNKTALAALQIGWSLCLARTRL